MSAVDFGVEAGVCSLAEKAGPHGNCQSQIATGRVTCNQQFLHR